jgi:Flp pilus assembly pilin Flp
VRDARWGATEDDVIRLAGGSLPFHARRGSTVTEYALIAALISVAILAGVAALGSGLENVWGEIASELP